MKSPETFLVILKMESSESACHRDYFYVGGNFVNNEKHHGQRVMQGQMYVEQLTPIGGARYPLPLIFIHGGGQTATVRFALGLGFACL